MISNISEKELDWFLVMVMVVIFVIALFLGFRTDTIFTETGITYPSRIVYVMFIVYGLIGLLRKRVLWGPRAYLATGIWAIIISTIDLCIGFSLFLYDIYKLFFCLKGSFLP